jgi:hypothetical protein
MNRLLVASLAEFLPVLDVEFPRPATFLGAGFPAPKFLVLYV